MSRPEADPVFQISEIILNLVDRAMEGELDEVPRGDVQGMTEAAAMRIVRLMMRYGQ